MRLWLVEVTSFHDAGADQAFVVARLEVLLGELLLLGWREGPRTITEDLLFVRALSFLRD